MKTGVRYLVALTPSIDLPATTHHYLAEDKNLYAFLFTHSIQSQKAVIYKIQFTVPVESNKQKKINIL